MITLRRLLMITFAFSSLLSLGTGCGGDGDSGHTSGVAPDTGRFRALGAEVLFQRGEAIHTPLIAVYGILGQRDVPGVLAEEIKCRSSADAVIAFPVSTGNEYLDPNATSENLRRLIEQLEHDGASAITVVGHHLGGIVARTALTKLSEDANTPITLITVFTPFGGIPNDAMTLMYPDALLASSPFIQLQSPLPSSVSHQSYEIAGTAPIRALTAGGYDRLLIDSQSNAAVDQDDALVVRERHEFLPWPLSITTQLQRILEHAGLGPNLCRPSEPVTPQDFLSFPVQIVRTLPKQDPASIQFDVGDFIRAGLQAPRLGGTIDPAKPTLIITHGVGASPSDLDRLEAAFVDDYNVFRFVYDESASTSPSFADDVERFSDETDDLVEISKRQAAAVKKVRTLTGQPVIYGIGYSLGGVIFRQTITTEGAGSLASEPFSVALVTVASPFGGSFAANFNPTFWLSSVTPLPGTFFARLASGSDYISNPGTVAPQNLHFPIKSIENGRIFNGKDDKQVSLEDQANPVVDTDPNNVAATFAGGSFQLVGGHLEIINNPNTIVVIKAAVDFLRKKKEGTPDPEPEPTATDGSAVGGADGGSPGAGTSNDEGTSGGSGGSATPDGAAGDGSEDGDASEEGHHGPRFGCRSGTYSPFGSSSCDLGQFEVAVGNGFVRTNPFGLNGVVTFDITHEATAEQDSLDILGGSDHTCTLLCTDSRDNLLAVRCTNPRGGRCLQSYSGVARH